MAMSPEYIPARDRSVNAALQCYLPCTHFQIFSGYGITMDKPAQNIQDSFLNNARKEKGLVTIYLLSGVKLSGRIKSFDKYSLVLETNNQEQLIFKHAISTVVTIRSPQHHTAPHPSNHQSAPGAVAQAVGAAPQSSEG
jgi:host factor-I protein